VITPAAVSQAVKWLRKRIIATTRQMQNTASTKHVNMKK
jgi:hypothetical protein